MSAYCIDQIESQFIRSAFRLEAARAVAILQQRLVRIEQAAQSAAFFIGADGKAARSAHSALSAYGAALKLDQTLPSLHAIDFAPAFSAASRTKRPTATPDIAPPPLLPAALRHAYDAGRAGLNGDIFIHAVNAPDEQPGFTLMLPVFSRVTSQTASTRSGGTLRGHVFAAVHSRALFADGLDEAVRVNRVHIDGRHSPMNLLVYESGKPVFADNPYQETASFNAAGQTWTVNLDAAPGFSGMFKPALAPIGIAVELSICLLVFWYMRQLGRASRAAVDAMPASPEDKLRQVEDAIGFGTYEIDIDLQSGKQSTQWSCGLYRILGRDMHGGAPTTDEFIARYVREADRQKVRAMFDRVFHHGGNAACEYGAVLDDGRMIYLHDSIEARATSPAKKKLCGIRRDISDKRQAENERFAAAVRFQALVEQLPGIPYLASLKSNRGTMYVSPKVEAVLGYRPEEWANDRALRIDRVHPEDRKKIMRAIAVARRNRAPFKMEYRIHHRNGDLLWIHDEARIVANDAGEPLFLQGVALDITERKQAQSELQLSRQRLQQMIAALDTLRDDEHKRLAREMHDDFGQLLIAMKMDLLALREKLPDHDRQLQRQMVGIQRLADTMITSVRRIIADLPPKSLDDNGLFKAVQLLTHGFAKRHQIACRLTLPQLQPALDERLATPIYRIAQEALTNVAKHAQATQVDIRITCKSSGNETQMVLCIKDNGKGMPPDAMQKTGSFGLIGMRERIAALAGEVHIDSAPGAGTALRITIPLTAPALARPVCGQTASAS